MNVDKTVGNNIRKYRTAYNMTLKELSARLNKSISTVSKYEKGDISLDLPTFMELVRIFKVSPSLLLGPEPELINENPVYNKTPDRLYMYTYDIQNKCIVQSLIEQYPSIPPSNTYRAQMFNDVKNINNPGNCGGFYVGKYTQEGFIGTYFLHNQMTTEHVLISCIHNLVNSNQLLGLMSGLSNYTLLPITMKVVISNTEITNKESLVKQLVFSKEDYRMQKKTNYLTVQNW